MPNQTLRGRSSQAHRRPRSHQIRMYDEMKEGDAGRNKQQQLVGPPPDDVEGSHSEPGVAAKWPGRRYLTVLIPSRPAGTSRVWPAGCGRRVPRSACWVPQGIGGQVLPIFPRLLPRRCRQMSCTLDDPSPSPRAAWQALQGSTKCHRGGIIVTMIDESQCRNFGCLAEFAG